MIWSHVSPCCIHLQTWKEEAGFAVCLTVPIFVQGEGGKQGDGARTIARGRSPVGILGRHLHSYHARAREGGAQGLGREFVIRVHQGKTKIWNAAGEKPPGCDELERTATVAEPTAVVWRGSEDLPSCRRGIKILGTPLGHQDFVTAQLEMFTAEHQTLLCRIPLVQDVQAAWLLLVHCAAARANCVARVVEPGSAEPFCRRHDAGLCSVCAQFCRSHQIKGKMWLVQLRCRWFWEVLGCDPRAE